MSRRTRSARRRSTRARQLSAAELGALDQKKKLILGAAVAGGVGLLLFTQRGNISTAAGAIVGAAKGEIFKQIIDDAAVPYADAILQVADEKNISPFVILAIMKRETIYGTAPGYTPKGSAGKGDAGHGYGLMQIDDRSFGDWLAANDWTNPLINIRKGVDILKSKMAYLGAKPTTPNVTVSATAAKAYSVPAGTYRDPRPLVGDDLVEASIAAYNQGEGKTLQIIAAGGDPDQGTSGKDYSSAVLATAKKLSDLYTSMVG